MNQAQNEALIYLMLAARFSDRKISLSESDAFQKHTDNLSWESGTSRDIFIQQATATVRKALSAEEATRQFMERQCAQFADSETKRNVFRIVESLMLADGMNPKENKFLLQVRTLLGV